MPGEDITPEADEPTANGGRRRPRQLVLPVTVAALGLASLGAIQILPNRQAVEHELTDTSTHALSSAGIAGARVTFDGRDATVHVRSASQRERALAVVRSQNGVRIARVVVDPPVHRSAAPAAPGGAGRPSPAATASASLSASPPNASVRPTASPPPAAEPSWSPPATEPSSPPATETPSSLPARSPSVPEPSAPAAGTAGSSAPTPPVPGSAGPTADQLAFVRAAVTAAGPLLFANNSMALTPTARARLVRIAAVLRAYPDIFVRIDGFTDARGSGATNLVLSRERAATVYHTLRVLGLPAARLATTGFGESDPLATNDTATGRQANRRVTFTLG
jgi:outer membrane protein OmpA-like peptidoglycan-associated protein